MTADGFLGQLWVAINVDTTGLANAAMEMEQFSKKVITTAKMASAATAQAANIPQANLGKAFAQESGFYRDQENNLKRLDTARKNAARQYGGYIKDQINQAKAWEEHQQKWHRVEESYYRAEAATKNKKLAEYNAARKLGNAQESSYYREVEAAQNKHLAAYNAAQKLANTQESNYYKEKEVTRNKALAKYNAAQRTANAQESGYWRDQQREAEAAERALAASTKGMTVSLNSLSNNLYRFGTFATMAFTLPIAAISTLGITTATELEQINQKTVALANVSQEQMDAWASSIRRLGIETNATSKSIAQALYFTASAGVDNANAMKLVEYAAKGSAAGLGETDDIAKLLTYTYNAYGKSVFDAAKLMDSLTVAVREGAAEATDFTKVMGDLIPIGAQLGVSFADLGGMLAGMTQIGLNSHKSATALRQVMMELIKPSHGAAEALDRAAVKMNDSSLAAGNLTETIEKEGLFQVLQKLKLASQTMGPLFLPTIFDNVRAFNGLMGMIGPNMAKVQEIIKKTKTEVGAFENALGIMTQTSAFKIGQFKKSWELAMQGLGEGILPLVLPIFKSLTETITEVTFWFKNLSTTTKWIISDFTLLLAIIGPVTIALSGLVRLWAILKMAMIPVVGIINGIRTAFVFLNATMLANPFIAAATAITLLTAASYAWYLKATELTASQQMLKDVSDRASASILSEKIAVEQILRVFNGYNSTNEQRLAALKKLQLLSPQYLGSLKEEEMNTMKAKKAIDLYLYSLLKKAEAQELAAEKEALIKNRVQALSSGEDKEIGFFKKLFLLSTYQSIASASAKKAADASNAFTLALLKLDEAMDVVNNNAVLKEESRLKKLAEDIQGAKDKVKALFDTYREAMETDQTNMSKPLEDYLQALKEIEAKSKVFSKFFSGDVRSIFDKDSELLSAKTTYFNSLISQGLGATKVVSDLADEIIDLQRLMATRDLMNGAAPNLGFEKGNITGMFPKLFDMVKGGSGAFSIKLGMPLDDKASKTYWEEIKNAQTKYAESLSQNENSLTSTNKNTANPWKMEFKDLRSLIELHKAYRDAAAERAAKQPTEANFAIVKAEADKISKLMKPLEFQEKMQKVNAYVQTIGNGMNSLISSWTSLIDAQQSKALAFIDKTAKAEGKSAEWVAKKKEQVDEIYNKKKKNLAIAQAIINGAMAITNIMATTVPALWPISIAFVAATTAAQVAVISAQPMAQGGIVPAGYPNDSYPARLTSGEVVVPPGKLSSLQGAGNQKQIIRIEGKLVAEGPDLVYVFNHQGKLMKSF